MVQNRGAPCPQTPAAGEPRTSRTLYDCVRARVRVRESERMNERRREKEEEEFQTDPRFSVDVEQRGGLPSNLCICD